MNKIEVALLLSTSYFLGGIPTGYLIGRLKGIDIRQHGSGNPGTANVYRTMGALPGIITFAADFLKGFAPSFIAIHYFYCEGATWHSLGHWWIPVTAGGLAIAGHIWTPFLGFKGGKGVATSAGVFTALLPWPTAGAFAVFGLVVAITRHISAGSMAASVTLPVLCVFLNPPERKPLTIMACAVCALIFYTHIPNIRRILRGKELSFEHKEHAPSAAGKEEGKND